MRFFLTSGGNWFKQLALIKEAFVEADSLGFDGALMQDHYMWGTRVNRTDANATLEAWVTLAYLAAKTESIRLGTIVTPIPFRPPSILAKMLSTLDILSNGRVILGVGAGWSQDEFEGYSEWNEPKVRVDKTKEGLELMIKLWTENEVTFDGKYYQARAAVLEPKPVQKPYPQLLFGGRGDRMLKLAGRYADICYIMSQFQPPGVSEEMREKVLNAAKKANRVDKVAFMTGAMGSHRPYDSMEYSQRVEEAIETGASYYLTAFPQIELEFIKKQASHYGESMGLSDFAPDILLQEGDLNVGDLRFQVIHTPGHSPGSVCLYWSDKKVLFTGDVVFNQGVGRTDLPGGNGQKLKQSILTISRLDVDYLLSGHGVGRPDLVLLAFFDNPRGFAPYIEDPGLFLRPCIELLVTLARGSNVDRENHRFAVGDMLLVKQCMLDHVHAAYLRAVRVMMLRIPRADAREEGHPFGDLAVGGSPHLALRRA